MLINLSNHPSRYWNDLQISKAKKLYDKIYDIEFPSVPPEADDDSLNKFVNDYKNKCIDILSKYPDENNAVHIMGEMTFTYRIVTELKKEGVECIASTTDRNTFEIPGTKISNFNFVDFRKY